MQAALEVGLRAHSASGSEVALHKMRLGVALLGAPIRPSIQLLLG